LTPHADTALLNALIKAHRWDRLLLDGTFKTVQAIADAENIKADSYVA